MMKTLSKALLTGSTLLLLAGIGFADTLELKDGRVLQGKYLGGTQAVLRFEVNGDIQTFPTNDIVALTFTRDSGRRTPQAAPPPQPPLPDNPRSDAGAPPPNAAYTPPPPPNNGPAYNGGDFTL